MEYLFPIAGVQFKIIAKKKSLPASALNNVIYRDFFLKGDAKDIIDSINIYLADAFTLPIERLGLIFDSQTSWAIYAHQDDFYIIDQYPPYSSPVWVARVHSKENRITLHCSSEIIDHQKRQLVFNPFTYPLDQILLMNFLANVGGMLIHSAGWRIKGSGWIFAGKSGVGKSTISNLIVETTGTTFLSDDRIVVRKIGQDYLMYGTPWPGDAGYAINESVPLKGIFFLSKGNENNIRKLSPSGAIARLMPVTSIPWYDREKVELMMDFCDALMKNIPMYELTFVPEKAAVDMLVEFINE